MTASLRGPAARALLAALAAVGLAVGGLLVGYEPTGGDPDCLYRPIKTELARSLAAGALPFWSDRFGLGVPLAAESHAAAFYPPNWALYRALSVPAAYRLAMWLHYVALAGATFAYARVLGLTEWGSALAAVAFSLCGFQASHACHEPFYHLLPFLPASLALTERYLAAGGLWRLGALALALGAQVTLGHFQIQMWTCGLVLLTALVRARRARGRVPWRRAAGVAAAVAGGLLMATPQLALSYELTRAAGFDRPLIYLTNYAFPPAHWAQPALPGLFNAFRGGADSAYWSLQATTPDEACLYVGTLPLVLAAVGLMARGDRALGPWKWAGALGFALATMPRWWPEGFRLLLHLPGLGHFRAPGRYTLLTSLALCLLAGRGFDRAAGRGRFHAGLALAVCFGVTAFAWAWEWSDGPGVRPYLPADARAFRVAFAAAAWALALGAVVAWRAGPLPSWGPVLLAACELTYLYYHNSTAWRWHVPFPASSPVFDRLARDEAVGLVAGDLQDLGARAGFAAAYPNLGIIAPPPNYLLERSLTPGPYDAGYLNLLRRYGVTHGAFQGPTRFRPAVALYLGPDPALDALLPVGRDTKLPRLWRLERYPNPFPPARAARAARICDGWRELYPALLETPDPDVALYDRADQPPAPPGPRARRAEVRAWDGRSGVVEHDGACDLVLRRTFYPGWSARVNGGPWAPPTRADGGLQALRLTGRGPSRVEVRYRPTRLALYASCSAAAALAALGLIAVDVGRAWKRRAGASRPALSVGTTGADRPRGGSPEPGRAAPDFR